MNLDEFIEQLQEMRAEYGGNLEIAAQVPLTRNVGKPLGRSFPSAA